MVADMRFPKDLGPGVRENPFGGYYLHMILGDVAGSVLRGPTQLDQLAPPGARLLAGMSVFENVVVLDLQGGPGTPWVLVFHVTDPAAAGSVLFFYHANGVLRRAVPLERLNPGWVVGPVSLPPGPGQVRCPPGPDAPAVRATPGVVVADLLADRRPARRRSVHGPRSCWAGVGLAAYAGFDPAGCGDAQYGPGRSLCRDPLPRRAGLTCPRRLPGQ